MQTQNFNVPTLTKLNKVIIIATVAIFILSNIFTVIPSYLGLSGNGFFSGHIYELLTYPFISRGLLEVVFNALLLWFVGSELENLWGIKRYFSFLAVSAVGAGLIYLVVASIFFSGSPAFAFPLVGLHGICTSLLLAYAILYPDRMFSFMLIFPVKAKWFCSIIIAMELFTGIFSPHGILAWGHLGAMACGYAFMVIVSSQWWLGHQSRSAARVDTIRKKRVEKSHLSVVKNDEDDKPKYWH